MIIKGNNLLTSNISGRMVNNTYVCFNNREFTKLNSFCSIPKIEGVL